MLMWMHHWWTCFCFFLILSFCDSILAPDTRAMFPGRFQNLPDSMWNFGWNPQSMGLHGQFCNGDPMGQQFQAQTQAQISALQQQNGMLNQHLHTQAQTHINHLQQLLPYHQPPQPPPSTPPPAPSATQPTVPQAPDPPTPVATPANQMAFSPDEMLQQMKSTVESRIQAIWLPLAALLVLCTAPLGDCEFRSGASRGVPALWQLIQSLQYQSSLLSQHLVTLQPFQSYVVYPPTMQSLPEDLLILSPSQGSSD